MLIGIDGNEANVKNRFGVGQYALQILKHLHQLDKKNQYIIYLKKPPLPDLPQSAQNWHYHVFGPQKLWTRLALPLHLYTSKPKPDIFYTPGHYTPPFCPCPIIPTIHDLGYLKYPEQFTKKDYHQLKSWTAQSIKKAHHLFTVSNFSKKEIQKIYHIPADKITVAPNGVGEPTKIPDKSPAKKPYFLCLGTLKPNKNIPFLIKAFSQFIKNHPDYQLIIAGNKGWLFDNIFTQVKKLKLEKKVIFTGFVDNRWSFYKHATALVIPSLYEGFGRPAIEAMKVNCPVIASSIPPLKEVVGDSGLFIDPKDQKTLVSAMNQIIKPTTKKQLIKAGVAQSQKYTWTKSAQTLIDTFGKIAQHI